MELATEELTLAGAGSPRSCGGCGERSRTLREIAPPERREVIERSLERLHQGVRDGRDWSRGRAGLSELVD